ncbi:TetR/AcrR family transcriptional regulator [Agromyces seonyuensis]|uniref:TetR family transcriptional regulator n=1 Tax=Agromyces seonyuensis TaxID=2662446 RepID=A0A6I4NRW6_9MICO|nr:TetR/AcrR family transcriptional regulator [Agromyces seonyuensis]MWB97166.1 TetR family transcriptional regulator [Agromyces seonyuensis]
MTLDAAETDDGAGRTRRPPQERGLRTQAAILDAAVRVLAEDGYAAASTVRVQERAGVSRGRLLHHFPSREELFVAAVHHLAAARLDELVVGAELPADPVARIAVAIDAMWASNQAAAFQASLELWLAARHDERLRAALLPTERRMGAMLLETQQALFGPELAARPGFADLMELLVSSMRGTALTYAITGADSSSEPNLALWRELVRDRLLGPAPETSQG